MGSQKDHHHEGDTAPPPVAAQPRHWKDALPVVPVKPQYDPSKIAKKYLDDMERRGVLHGRLTKGA